MGARLELERALEIATTAPEQTVALGRLLGARLEAGDCVALLGELGAGKTTFTSGLGAGMGVDAALASPTYLLCCEYEGRCRLLHLDAYFAERLESLLGEGLAERFQEETVIVAEWAGRVAEWLPEDRLELTLDGEGEARRLVFRALGERSAARLEGFRQALRASPGLPQPADAAGAREKG